MANAILHPYSIEVKSVAWSSVYEVGQRLTDRFDDIPDDDTTGRLPHVFIAGDACHTHSAKAGQGMNVSMQDAFNLGWKLAAVLVGRSGPALLQSYSAERQTVAKDLIEFDKLWSAFVAQPTVDPEHPELGGVTAEAMHAEFAPQGRYTAGLATQYRASALTGTDTHQELATGFEIGTCFHSAPVIRVADAKPLHLGHAHRADGRWRIYAFDGVDGGLHAFADWLGTATDSPVQRFRAEGADVDAVIDVHGIRVLRRIPRGAAQYRAEVTESPLEPEPQRHTGYLIRRAQPAHLAAWNRIVSTEISSVQYAILVTLDRLGEASQRELCDEIDLDRSTIADLVSRMERRDLIARQRSREDARRNTVTLTEHGRAERMLLQPLVAQVEDALTGALTPDTRAGLRGALRRVETRRVSPRRRPRSRRPGGSSPTAHPR